MHHSWGETTGRSRPKKNIPHVVFGTCDLSQSRYRGYWANVAISIFTSKHCAFGRVYGHFSVLIQFALSHIGMA